MTQKLVADLKAFLETHGWIAEQRRTFGTIWSKPNTKSVVGLPNQLNRNSYEFDGILKRISTAESISTPQLLDVLSGHHFDEIRFRAASACNDSETISFQQGKALVDLAWTSLRSTGTTADHKKSDIRKYSKHADRCFRQARMAHTEHGSYILPVLLPLGIPEAPEIQDESAFDNGLIQEQYVEPEARKITRTLNNAFSSLHRVIEKDQEPRGNTLTDLVYAGVSRQLVRATRDFLALPDNPSVCITIQWSPAYSAPESGNIKFDSSPEIVELLDLTHKRLKEMKEPVHDSIVGTLAGLEFRDSEATGTIAVQCERQGKMAVVYVTLDRAKRETAIAWLEKRATIVARGTISTDRFGLAIPNPISVYALGEFQLDKTII